MRKVTEFLDYKQFISAYIDGMKKRGAQATLARAAGCQNSYLSQVLKGKAHLTLDQAYGISKALELGEIELEYFLLLLDLAKASGKPLRERIEAKLRRLRERFSARQYTRNSLPADMSVEFYSSWAYKAVYAFLKVKHGRTTAAVAARFGLNEKYAEKVLLGLEKMKLAEAKGGQWFLLPSENREGFSLHWDSPMFHTSQMTGRVKALEEILRGNPSYCMTQVFASSPEVHKAVVRLLEKFNEDLNAIQAENEGGEDVFLMNLDFIRI